MANVQPGKRQAKKQAGISEAELPQLENYLILILGSIIVMVGYIVMIAGDAVSPLSVTVAPIILVIGYCVVIPIGIIFRKKTQKPE
jgi:hypothetical protein